MTSSGSRTGEFKGAPTAETRTTGRGATLCAFVYATHCVFTLTPARGGHRCVYAVFSLFEVFIQTLLYWIPFYYAFKVSGVAVRGASCGLRFVECGRPSRYSAASGGDRHPTPLNPIPGGLPSVVYAPVVEGR